MYNDIITLNFVFIIMKKNPIVKIKYENKDFHNDHEDPQIILNLNIRNNTTIKIVSRLFKIIQKKKKKKLRIRRFGVAGREGI